MPTPRVRLRTLMIAVAIVGLALVALRSPSLLAASTAFTLTIGALSAVPLIVAWGGRRRRPFWSGFVVFGWGHMLLAWRNPLGMPQVVTVYLMLYLGRSVALGRSDSGFLPT